MTRSLRNTALFLLLAGIILFSLACSKDDSNKCLGGRGETTVENRGFYAFGNISIHDNINLKIIQGPERKATIRTGDKIMSSVTTAIENNTLYIRNKSVCTLLTNPWNYIEVELTVPGFDTLFISSAGSVTTDEVFVADSAWIKIEDSSGDIDLTFDIYQINVHYQKGTSNVLINGSGNHGIFYTAAYGVIDTRGFCPKHTTVNNGSANNCYVNSGSSTLDAKITNIGNIYYQGDPVNLIEAFEGSGKIIKLD
jgi:hypothetical protein